MLKDLIQRKNNCVLATLDAANPHTFLMLYLCSPGIRFLYFVILRDTQKCENIEANPAISFLWAPAIRKQATLQKQLP
ncbi:MAG: pyridoxamine 5'-phosphate oxidase family protein [Desulfobacteraceae bacterium]|nr:pyridoxamine 5'-phosphate oxidase family protein [Desulfobacteraceae bacterium]